MEPFIINDTEHYVLNDDTEHYVLNDLHLVAFQSTIFYVFPQNTFQLVFIWDSSRTFVVFNYLDVNQDEYPCDRDGSISYGAVSIPVTVLGLSAMEL